MSIITETRLRPHELDMIEQWLEEDGTPLHAVDINDFFWFETDSILKALKVDDTTFWAREERA